MIQHPPIQHPFSTPPAARQRRGGSCRFGVLLVLIAALLPASARAQVGQIDGVVVADYDAQLALPVAGVVAEIAVAPGDRVEAGAMLARLDNTQARIQVELARLAAPGESELKLAQEQLRKVRESHDEQAIRAAEARAAQYARARLELQLAEARLARHVLMAPVAGVVERITASAGQFLAAGQPVVRLVQVDRPIIEAQIPSDVAAELVTGDSVLIHPAQRGTAAPTDRHEAPLAGRIAYLSPVIDPMTDARFARIIAAQPPASQRPTAPILRVGAHVSITLGPQDATPASPSPASAP